MRKSWLLPTPLAIFAGLVMAGCGSVGSSVSIPAPAKPTPVPAYLGELTSVSKVGSTVPANGDVNPYGLVDVPATIGRLHAGDFLVTNFNSSANAQGTGSTIVELTPTGKQTLFAQVPAELPGSCPGGVGLTTALSVLPGGYVIVGSLPTSNGMSDTAQAGCLIELSSTGQTIGTIAGKNIQGPWDMTSVSLGSRTDLFVSMALDGGAAAGRRSVDNATVVRIALTSGPGRAPQVLSQKVIADGIPWRDDPAALVIGPTGVALGANGDLYVADTLKNRISVITHATTRTVAAANGGATLTQGGALKMPLGLIVAPNGNLIAANAGNGNLVEITPAGKQVVTRTVVARHGAGALFGLTTAGGATGVYFVNDADDTLDLLH